MKRNLVFFVAEDLDYEGISCYDAALTGYTGLIRAGFAEADQYVPLERVCTPHIARLAREGVTFDQYYCAAPVCTAARYTLFTGNFPERSREVLRRVPDGQETVWFDASLSPGEPSLLRALHDAGYATSYFGKFHNFPKDFHREMEKTYYPPKPLTPESQAAVRRAYDTARRFLTEQDYGIDYADRIYFDNPEPFQPPEISSHNPEWIVEGAREHILRRKGDERPFAVYVAVSVPHQRYDAARLACADPRASASGYLSAPPQGVARREGYLSAARDMGLCPDAAEGMWLDDAFGAIRDAVRAIGKDDDTAYVFTTDHPTAGKGSCHLGRIPLILRCPGVTPEGLRNGDLLSETDLAPTVADMLGLPREAEFGADGRSFWDRVRKDIPCPDAPHRRYAFMQIVNSRGVTDGRYKYIANRLPDDSEETLRRWRSEGWRATEEHGTVWFKNHRNFPSYWDADEFFDLQSDPMEQHNLAGEARCADEMARLRDALRDELRRMPHTFAEFTE